MNLTELISSGPSAPPGAPRGPPLGDPEIVGITADSRQVKPGFLFAALRGTQQDGRAFAADAVKKGAAVLLRAAQRGEQETWSDLARIGGDPDNLGIGRRRTPRNASRGRRIGAHQLSKIQSAFLAGSRSSTPG